MNIRKKILGAICAITVALILIFAVATSLVIQKRFDQLERNTVIHTLERVQATFNDQIQALDTLTHDWANWDDTYIFVKDHNKEYLASNVVKETFTTSANIDVLLIIKSDGDLVHGVFYNTKKHRMETPEKPLLSTLLANKTLLNPVNKAVGTSGIVQFGSQFLIIAARPILTSNGAGPSRGTLIMGRILNEKRMNHLQKITRTLVNIYPLQSSVIPAEATNAIRELYKNDSPFFISVFSEDIIHGYTLLHDVSGKPSLVLAINIKREIHQQTHQTLNFLIFSIIVTGSVFGLIVYFLIDTLVLGRLTALTHDIVQIEEETDSSLRVREFSSNDELGKLSLSINHMMDAIESLEKYKIKGEKLEVLATFAAGATHEFATPLSTIAIASGEILHELQQNNATEGDLYEDILLIRDQVNRCKDILYQVAADAGQHMGEEVESISTGVLIHAAMEKFDPEILQHIEIDNTMPDQVIHIPARSLRRVLRGIVKNSLDASKDGQHSVSLFCCATDTHLLFIIRDHGEGMDEHTLQHAADPFFTTKSPGNGMGLGLYLAESIASRFSGSLQISSTPDTGTTVTLSFAKDKIYASNFDNFNR